MSKPSPTAAPVISIIASIAALAGSRKAWLVDIWGVMHNGVTPFAAAAHACTRFREGGGTVLLLSNAPRPAPSVMAQLDRIGVPRESYDGILTSGDAARQLICEAVVEGRKIGHLGPERDRPLLEGIDAPIVALEAAEIVVCTGLFDDETETPESYAAMLSMLHANGADMICANPDLTVERGGQIVYCAGALAQAFEARGGNVAYAGKPYPPVYRLAMQALETLRGGALDKSSVLAIGDGVHTDIAGAAAAGIDSVYIASGVHLGSGVRLDAASVETLFRDAPGRPIAAMTHLAW